MKRSSRDHDTAQSARYTVRAVADRVGVPIATLRSWNQRYGIGPRDHNPGKHRLYNEADIAMVQRVHRLINKGVNPRSAARAALDSVVPARSDSDALLTAAFDLDFVTAGRLLDGHLIHYGVVDTWEELIRPAFAAIEARQADGGGCVDVEHALSWAVTRSLQRMPITSPGKSTVTILACCEAETHTLALDALRAALGERVHGALMLGADVPCAALIDAIGRTSRQTTVVLWAQTGRTADVAITRAVIAAHARLLVGGPGWKAIRLPRKATRIHSLDAALLHLTAV